MLMEDCRKIFALSSGECLEELICVAGRKKIGTGTHAGRTGKRHGTGDKKGYHTVGSPPFDCDGPIE